MWRNQAVRLYLLYAWFKLWVAELKGNCEAFCEKQKWLKAKHAWSVKLSVELQGSPWSISFGWCKKHAAMLSLQWMSVLGAAERVTGRGEEAGTWDEPFWLNCAGSLQKAAWRDNLAVTGETAGQDTWVKTVNLKAVDQSYEASQMMHPAGEVTLSRLVDRNCQRKWYHKRSNKNVHIP